MDNTSENTADVLLDLRERIIDGAALVRVEASRHGFGSTERARLNAKAEGLELALDYVRHSLSLAAR